MGSVIKERIFVVAISSHSEAGVKVLYQNRFDTGFLPTEDGKCFAVGKAVMEFKEGNKSSPIDQIMVTEA